MDNIYTSEYWMADANVEGFTQNKYINPILYQVHLIQNKHGCQGDISEIGVHHGKSFIPLLMLLADDEKGVAIDCYDQQHLNVDKSGKGSLTKLEENCKAVNKWEQVVVCKGNSIDMNPEEWLIDQNRKFRIFSVDGCHTKEATYIDLVNVASVMSNMGVIIVDDYLNLSWPGVRAGVDQFMSETKEWRPIFLGYNKMFLCRAIYYDIYWSTFQKIEDEILNKASSVYRSTIKDVAHFEYRMILAKVW